MFLVWSIFLPEFPLFSKKMSWKLYPNWMKIYWELMQTFIGRLFPKPFHSEGKNSYEGATMFQRVLTSLRVTATLKREHRKQPRRLFWVFIRLLPKYTTKTEVYTTVTNVYNAFCPNLIKSRTMVTVHSYQHLHNSNWHLHFKLKKCKHG